MKTPETTVKRSRRKWARRGYAFADFFAGLVGGLLEYGVFALRAVFAFVVALVRRAVTSARLKKSQTESASTRPNAGRSTEHQAEPMFQPLRRGNAKVRFDDIAGLDEAKREISLRMILPLRHPEKARRYRIRQGGGILLYGPPGTGKTMLAKAVATELGVDFFHIAPADLMSSDVGGAEKNVAELFRVARASKRAVVFLDEIDALVPRRRNNGSTIMRRVVSQILGEVDGMRSVEQTSDLLLIGATNEIEMIDPAMLRPGRFDAKIFIGPPDEDARRKLLSNLLDELPLGEDFSVDVLAQYTDGLTGAEIKGFVQLAADDAFLRHVESGEQSPLQFKFEREEATTATGPVANSAGSGWRTRKSSSGQSVQKSDETISSFIPVHQAARAVAKTKERAT